MTTVRIALAQLKAGNDTSANLDRIIDAMERASKAGAHIVAFAELAACEFFPQYETCDWAHKFAETIPGNTTERIAATARALGLVTIFNMYEVQGDKHFDSSPVFDADGTLLGCTRMVHITDYEHFHERNYYDPGDNGAAVYHTKYGRIGVAICYDRHYPEYMRRLAVSGADLVVIPQAGALDEWPEGMYEAEVRTAAFQNGYFVALCNRVGVEDHLTFAGESFVVGPKGEVLSRAKRLEDDLTLTDLNFAELPLSPARRLFLEDRRPELYENWVRT